MATEEIIEEEEVLEREISELDEITRDLAVKFEEIASIDCDFGACVFDPEMEKVEHKIDEVQRRKKLLQSVVDHLDSLRE